MEVKETPLWVSTGLKDSFTSLYSISIFLISAYPEMFNGDARREMKSLYRETCVKISSYLDQEIIHGDEIVES